MVGKRPVFHQVSYMNIGSSNVVPMVTQRRTSAVLPSPVLIHRTAVSDIQRRVEPPVIRKTFPESWIFDSLIVDKEYVRNSFIPIYCSMFGIHLFVKSY